MIIYLVYWRPLNSHFANMMETFNEVTCVILMYHLQLFSDFVPEAETRSHVGTSFIVVIALNISVHLYFMLGDSLRRVSIKLKACCRRNQNNSETEQAEEKKDEPQIATNLKHIAQLSVIEEESEKDEAEDENDRREVNERRDSKLIHQIPDVARNLSRLPVAKDNKVGLT